MVNEEHKIEAKDCSRISNLPNDILSWILSLLSIKEAFMARLLSRQWRNISPHITNLSLDSFTVFGESTDHISKRLDYHYDYPKPLMDRRIEFVSKVDQCLKHLRVPKLKSLRVSFCLRNEYSSYIDEWIRLAVSMGVEKIDLDDLCHPESSDELYSFPCQLLRRPLEHLSLGSCIIRPGLDSTNSLNSLKTLTLATVPLDQTDLDAIFAGCLKLECLTLWNCIFPEIFRISGQLRHLKSLSIGSYRHCYSRKSLSRIEIHDVINLNQFEFKGLQDVEFSFKGLPFLKRLHLWVKFLTKEFVFDALPKAIPGLQNLSLCFFTTKDGPIPENITKFNCVKHMELFAYVSSDFNLLSFTYIINAAPLLETLHISLGRGYSKGPLHPRPQPRTYNKHVHLQLKEVEISGFHNRKNEVELAVYLLHNCIALEKMTINLQARIYHINGAWSIHNNSKTTKKEVQDRLIKEILDSNIRVELIVL